MKILEPKIDGDEKHPGGNWTRASEDKKPGKVQVELHHKENSCREANIKSENVIYMDKTGTDTHLQ